MGVLDRLKHAWNAFTNEEKPHNLFSVPKYYDYGYSSTFRPDRTGFTKGNEKSIITAVYNRMAVDCASIPIKHVKLDEQNRYKEDVSSDLNYCLTTESNNDQQSRAFIQDIVMSLFDEGVVAVVPVDTSKDINKENAFDADRDWETII